MQTLKVFAVGSLKIKGGSKNGDNKAKFPTLHKSFKWGGRDSTIFSISISMMKLVSQTFKYTSVRHHITITNKDACFSESCEKACRRGLHDERHRPPGAHMLPPSQAMSGEGMTIRLWGTAGASGRTHTSRTLMLDSASTPGDMKSPWMCIAPHSRRCRQVCGGLWLRQELADAVGKWGKWDSEAGLVPRAEPDASSLRDVSPRWPWDDTLVLHCAAVWNSFLIPRNSFDSPQQRDLEERDRKCAEGLFFITWSHICLTSS